MVNGYTGPFKTDLEPDDHVMFQFLGWWFENCDRGAIEICWRDPVTGKLNLIRRFALDDTNAAARFAAETNVSPGCSVYFRPATVGFNQMHTTDADIVQVPGPWGDYDTTDSVERLHAIPSPRPSAEIVTGRIPGLRVQPFYKFSGEPILTGSLVRQLNQQICALAGGDSLVINPSSLMRLPGSIAWPWKPGREPELTEWTTPDGGGATYTLDALRAALPPVEPDPNGHAPADADTTAFLNPVRALLDQARTGPAWHDPVLRLVAILVARGTPTCVIESLAPELTWSGYTAAQTRAELVKMIEGAQRKGFAPEDASMFSEADSVDNTAESAETIVNDVMDVRSTKQPTFPLFTDADIENMPDPEWLIPDFLVANTLAPIYGPPSSYKSFLALHIALCLATGNPWFERPVVQCDTLYIAAEGAAGMKLRQAAWKTHHQITTIPGFRVVPCIVNLMDATEAKRLILTVVEAEKASGFNPKVVVVDTLHRSMPGADENSSQHMGLAITNCTLIQTALACCLIPVHHTGKDTERGMRGSNSLFGAADSVTRVTRAGEQMAVLTEKMKDAEDGQLLQLRALKITLPAPPGTITARSSLVLVPDDNAPIGGTIRLNRYEQMAKQILADLIIDEGISLPTTGGFPSPLKSGPLRGVPESRWAEECEARRLSVSDKLKSRLQAFRRAYQGLLDSRQIAARNGLVWLVR